MCTGAGHPDLVDGLVRLQCRVNRVHVRVPGGGISHSSQHHTVSCIRWTDCLCGDHCAGLSWRDQLRAVWYSGRWAWMMWCSHCCSCWRVWSCAACRDPTACKASMLKLHGPVLELVCQPFHCLQRSLHVRSLAFLVDGTIQRHHDPTQQSES